MEIIGTNIPLQIGPLSVCTITRKSTAKVLEEKDQLIRQSLSDRKEKKFIISHSMRNSNRQSSPTARLENIKQTSISKNKIMATTSSTTNIKKPILITRSSENSSKTPSRNVRFGPEIILDDEQVS